jgi:hypothetical protein
VADVELTQLSFDERMAYYKQKYAGSADAESRASSAGKRPPRRKERVDTPDASTVPSDDKRQTMSANHPVKGKAAPAPSKPDTQSGRGSPPDAARRKDTPTERQPDRRKGISGKAIAEGKPARGKSPTPEKPEQRADGAAVSDSAASGGDKASKGILSRIFGFLKK